MGLSQSDIFDKTNVGVEPSPGIDQPVSSTASSSSWITGDYKVSAQAADHADPSGGFWRLCDGTALPTTDTGLVSLFGANRPDARGRSLVMQGTNAAVNTLLANDGVAVANRRPQHRHTPHSHTEPIYDTGNGYTVSGAGHGVDHANNLLTTFTTDGGSGTSTDSLDAPAFLVPGNLFVHT